MDVELQVIKHLARDAQKTIPLVDEYCRDYRVLFPEVRSYEYFKYLHLGIVSEIKRKSLPEIAKAVGLNSPQSLHGLRTWVEYGFKQCKQELGWTDYRFTQFEHIERWWEMVFSAYLMVSLQTQPFTKVHQLSEQPEVQKTVTHELLPSGWNSGTAWKNRLNNIRLLMRPLISLWLISPWLEVFPNHGLLMGFHRLIQSLTQFHHDFSSA
jgi:hypothetical protein